MSQKLEFFTFFQKTHLEIIQVQALQGHSSKTQGLDEGHLQLHRNRVIEPDPLVPIPDVRSILISVQFPLVFQFLANLDKKV